MLKINVKLLTLGLAFGSAMSLFGSSLQERFIEEFKDSDSKQYFTITTENDLFGSGSDQNYTNGLRISWFEIGNGFTVLEEGIEKTMPFISTNESTTYSYSVGQNLYTPKNIESRTLDKNSRPWAAFLYASMSITTLHDDFLDEYEITLGIVGPSAQGKPVQRNVHKATGSPIPRGWDNQIKDEPGVIVSWQRRWPRYWMKDLENSYISFSPNSGISLGNVYTYVNAGGFIKWSTRKGKLHDKPLFVRPAMPGTGFFFPSKDYSFDIFTGLEGRAMVRNIFLDGNTFRSSHSVNKKYLVLDASAGVSFIFEKMRLSYTTIYRTKEFNRQDEESLFGAISMSYNF